jgi:biopolymer transport protein ExbB
MLALMDALATIKAFMEQGGPVLIWISLLTLVMWTLIIERSWFFRGALKGEVQDGLDTWEAREERKSWNARKIRDALISRVSLKVDVNMSMIQALVALAPLLGLLGTVTGMIEVFNVLAVTGGGDAKSMAGGVSQATIPTMAGMVAALSGVFGNTYVTNTADREKQLLEDRLTMDH